jgi:hypothetical protein
MDERMNFPVLGVGSGLFWDVSVNYYISVFLGINPPAVHQFNVACNRFRKSIRLVEIGTGVMLMAVGIRFNLLGKLTMTSTRTCRPMASNADGHGVLCDIDTRITF